MSLEAPFLEYGKVMRQRFGGRIQKLAIDAGLSCPNRDGKIGFNGCTFCLNEAFSPSYCRECNSLYNQVDKAIDFHLARNRKAEYYIAYLQSGSNTYADSDRLRKIYSDILSHPEVSGLIIGTRPDCVSSEILDILEDLSHSTYIAIEYGIESVYDTTLARVNRGHNFQCAIDAVNESKARGLDVGAHFILGLPTESHDDIIAGISRINALDLDFIKFHQLQIYRNTALEREYTAHPERFIFANNYTSNDYVNLLCDIIRHLKPSIAIERLSSLAPRHLLRHSPLQGIKPDILRSRVIERMHSLNATQGDLIGTTF
ncbi:MAG: TIGR01212 family radical SAM protein [Alistipes sp.]|nr:TIGR01212 family radical SAM protein [Alistipes sp.]